MNWKGKFKALQAGNSNLRSMIEKLTEAAKLMQTKQRGRGRASAATLAKDEEIRLIKEAAVIEIEKVKKMVEKQQNDIVL